MSELLVYKGIPASGKTTAAKELVSSSGCNYGRVNRDTLREMIFNSKWSREREKVIVDTEKAIAQVLLHHGYSVVVDDTNFKNVWKEFLEAESELSGKEISYKEKFFDIPLEECIRRDALRESPVGRTVITKMALRNGLVEFPDLPIVLVDIDGTLAQSTGRERHLAGEKKDWKSYYSLLHTDVPAVHIFRWVAELAKDHTIVIVSGRGAEHEEQTLAWFEKVWSPNPLFPELEVPKFKPLVWLFRDKNDRREDSVVKLEYLDLLPTRPVLVLDDRPQVVKAWRSRGIFCIPVAGECEDF